jgi:hypothetical protein
MFFEPIVRHPPPIYFPSVLYPLRLNECRFWYLQRWSIRGLRYCVVVMDLWPWSSHLDLEIPFQSVSPERMLSLDWYLQEWCIGDKGRIVAMWHWYLQEWCIGDKGRIVAMWHLTFAQWPWSCYSLPSASRTNADFGLVLAGMMYKRTKVLLRGRIVVMWASTSAQLTLK